MNNGDILSKESFEALFLFEQDSKTNQAFDKLARPVFAKMVRNLGINVDDFQFMVFDDGGKNAFFLSGDKTKNGKNLIAFSCELLREINTREELAAIMAHECGHYIWEHTLGGKNSIFQERGADLYAVDLMMNAGYNPQAILNIYDRLFFNKSYRVSYEDISLDVHGNIAMRLDDIKAYLTKISNERGYFDTVSLVDDEYAKDIVKILNFNELTCDFFTHQIFNRFGRRSVNDLLYMYPKGKISLSDFLRFLIEQIDAGYINSKIRAESFLKMATGIQFAYGLTKEQVDLCREIFIKYQQLPVVSETQAYSLFNMMDYHNKFTKEYLSKELFGPFKQHADYLQLFINSAYDEAQAEKYAEICMKQAWIWRYREEFKNMWPRFRALGEKNIGKKLPWVQMAEYDGQYTRALLKKLTGKDFFSLYSLPEYPQDKYLIEDDIVVEYGDNIQDSVYDKAFEKIEEKIRLRIAHLDMMIKLDSGEISVAQYDEFIEKNGGLDFVYSFITGSGVVENSDLINKSKKARSFLYNIYEMDFFKKLIARNQIVKKARSIPDKVAEKLYLFTSGEYFKEMRILAAKSLAQVAEYKSQNTTMSIEISNRNIASIYHKIDYNILRSDFSTDTMNGIMWNLLENVDSFEKQFFGNALKDEKEKFASVKEDIWYDIAVVASKNKYVMGTESSILSSAIRIDFERKRPSVVFKNKLKYWKLKEPQSPDEFWEFIQNPNVVSTTKYVMMINYILSGKKFYVPGFFSETEPVKIGFVDISDIFSQYMADNNAFNIENIDVKIQIYMGMLERGLFSERMANKNEYAKIIVDELVSIRDFSNPKCQKNVGYVHDILLRKSLVKDDNDFEFVNEREKLIDFYAQYWAQKLGRDDGSAQYIEKIQPVIDLIIPGGDNVAFSPVVANSFVRKFTDKIVAQKQVADILEKVKTRPIDGKVAEDYDWFGRGAEALISALARTPTRARLTIDFLSNRFSQKSYDNYMSNMDYKNILYELRRGNPDVDRYMGKENLMLLHENFWAADLPIRAVIINKLLNAGYPEDKDKINMILDMFFDKNSEYRKDAELVIKSVYYNLKDYERNLIVAAIVCAGQRDENNTMSGGQAVGQGLKMFLQNKGSAFIKFGQLLSYMPNLDSDIRKELATMRDKADIPSRYELFEMIEATLPQQVRDDITDVGEILGAGSFYVTIKIKYKGQDCVIGLMRPNVADLTSSGMEMIDATINDIVEKDAKYRPLNKIVKQARASAESEIDIDSDYQKYLNAVDLYESLRVSTPTGDYSPDVAKWMAHGKNSDGSAYKIMEMSPGGSLISDEWTADEKHDFAMAYVTLELCILLSGQQWDTDRHQGQQNFYNHAFRDFVIGIFDTAAQMDEKPNTTDKVMLGMVLFDMLESEKNGKDLSDILMQETNDKLATRFGATPAYIDGVKRGLTALSDIIEYQKEIKDENGNIIQESKRLSRGDMQNILTAVIKSGVVSKTVLSTIGARAIISGMLSDMAKYAFSGAKSNNPIKVEYNKKKNDKKSKRIDKSKQELEKLIEEKNKEKKFGIKKKYIKSMSDDDSLREAV